MWPVPSHSPAPSFLFLLFPTLPYPAVLGWATRTGEGWGFSKEREKRGQVGWARARQQGMPMTSRPSLSGGRRRWPRV